MEHTKEESISWEERGVSPEVNSEKCSPLSLVVDDSRRDEALDFLNEFKNDESVELSKVATFTKGLRSKIDRRFIPFLFVCYILTFIDKVLLNYARIMGMSTQLNLTVNNFSSASSSFHIAVLLFSLPNMWLLNRFPVAKCLSIYLMGWGLATACHAALSDYSGLVTVRVISGAFEAGILPALMLLTSQYFTYSEQSTRFGFWYMGMGTGQILGGLISYGFQWVLPTAPLAGWKIMFLVLGLITLLFGAGVLLFVPDTPMKAKFLSNDEKVTLLEHIKVNQTGIDNKNFHPSQLLEGVLDLGCWGLFLIIIFQSSGSGVVTAYSATILTSYGYSPKEAALLNMPSGIVNIICTITYAIYVRYYGNRWLVNVAAGVVATMAAALLSFLPTSNRPGLLTGMYLINVLPGATSIVFHWLACNVAGHTKRTYATSGMNAAFAIGNIIGPLTFRTQDAPQFRPAKLILTIMWAASIVIAFLLFVYYTLANKSRDKKSQAEGENVADTKAYAGLTDKQNVTFRYHL